MLPHADAGQQATNKRQHQRRSPSPSICSCKKHPSCYTTSTTASLGSKDALAILNQLCTPAQILFDPRFTSRKPPSPLPPFRTYPPSPTTERVPFTVPSTISIQNLSTEDPPVEMDKRHPSSFQQLEKLGEGTYATVSMRRTFRSIQEGVIT